MIEQFLKLALTEIRMGVSKKRHPFRYVTLATTDAKGTAHLRTVVVRHVTEDFKLRIYTDSRSSKVSQLEHSPQASLLFYHPKKLLQLKLIGNTRRIEDKGELEKYYSGVQPSSRKDYTTVVAPGTKISNPDAVAYDEDRNYFTILEIEPTALEFLQLKRPNHIRVSFSKKGIKWDGHFMNP